MKKPRVLGEEYETRIVQRPPPRPPEYEPIDAWPRVPRYRKREKNSGVKTVILLVALLMLIVSIGFSATSVLQLSLLQRFSNIAIQVTTTTSVVSIHQITTTAITTITKVAEKISIVEGTYTRTYTLTTTKTILEELLTGSLSMYLDHNIMCKRQDIKIEILNVTISSYNTTHVLLSLEIFFPENMKIDKSNFSATHGLYFEDLKQIRTENGYKIYEVTAYVSRDVFNEHRRVEINLMKDQQEALCTMISISRIK